MSLFASLDGQLDKLLTDNPAIIVEELLSEKLKHNRMKDLLTGRTNFSVNKTDLLLLRIKNQRCKKFSTGEQKIIIFSIIFSFLNS